MKELTYLFGVSAYAVSAVLAAFMAGLALGSWFFGKRTAFEKPLAVYAWLELGVGAAGLCSLFLFRGMLKIYPVFGPALQENFSFAGLTLLRFLFAVPLAGLPAFFMGGTLPVFSQAVAKGTDGLSGRVAAAYGINTLGGAVAAILGAYFFLYRWGLFKTVLFAACLNAGLFLGALALEKYGKDLETEKTPVPPFFDLRASSAIPVAFLTGFLSFVYEVVVFHLLGTIIGNTVYAFGIMLFSFLTAIVAGGWTACFVLKNREVWRWVLPGSQFFAGLCILSTLPFWDRLSGVFVWVGQKNPTFFEMELTRFAVSFPLLFFSALFMTQTFPLLFVFKDQNRIADRMGKLYSANTLGAILGALAGSFFFLPFLGSQLSLEIMALFNLVLGCALMGVVFPWKRVTKLALLLGSFCVFTFFSVLIPPWDIGALTSGDYVYFNESNRRGKVIYAHEDVLGGFTTVLQDSLGHRTLMTNGKFQGNNSGESVAQRNIVRIPALFFNRFQKAFVIGLGTGQSLESALEYPFTGVDVAEIAPAVVTASRSYFRDINRNALVDVRVKLYMEDGRNFLLGSRNAYDLITMEVNSIWIAGASNLYNQEFYELCRDHLQPGGVVQQWIQIHHITLEDIARSLRSLSRVFPHVVFFVSGSQGIAAASMMPLQVHVNNVSVGPHSRNFMRDFLPIWDFYLDERGVREFLGDTLKTSRAPYVSTDDQPVLEYSTPYGNSLGDRLIFSNSESLASYSKNSQPPKMAGFHSQEEKNLILAFFYRTRNRALANRYFQASHPFLESRKKSLK